DVDDGLQHRGVNLQVSKAQVAALGLRVRRRHRGGSLVPVAGISRRAPSWTPMTVTVACALVKCAAVIGVHVAVVALAVAGCGSGDSTASKTPGPTAEPTPSGTPAPP